MLIKNVQLSTISSILGRVSFVPSISVPNIVALVNLKATIDGLAAPLKEASLVLFTSYSLIPDAITGAVDWSTNPRAAEITEKWQELCNIENTIAVTFSDPELFAKLATGLSMAETSLLQQILA